MKTIYLDRHAIDEFHSLFNGGEKSIPDNVYLINALYYKGTVHNYDLHDIDDNLINDLTDIPLNDVHRLLNLAYDGAIPSAPKLRRV